MAKHNLFLWWPTFSVTIAHDNRCRHASNNSTTQPSDWPDAQIRTCQKSGREYVSTARIVEQQSVPFAVHGIAYKKLCCIKLCKGGGVGKSVYKYYLHLSQYSEDALTSATGSVTCIARQPATTAWQEDFIALYTTRHTVVAAYRSPCTKLRT